MSAAPSLAHDLYERYSGQIFGFCVNQLGSREEAEDALQSTFLNAHRALQRGVLPEAELPWLFKIAHNVCLTRRRSTRRRGRIESPSDFETVQDVVPAPAREPREELMLLTDALAEMPDNQRRAILLREWKGLSYHEIADELELSQSAVETLIFRARRTLAANLESTRGLFVRARRALDLGSIAAALKALAGGTAAVKATAAAVAVTGAVVVATGPGDRPRASVAQDAPAVEVSKAGAALTAAAEAPIVARTGPTGRVVASRTVVTTPTRSKLRSPAPAPAEAAKPERVKPVKAKSRPIAAKPAKELRYHRPHAVSPSRAQRTSRGPVAVAKPRVDKVKAKPARQKPAAVKPEAKAKPDRGPK